MSSQSEMLDVALDAHRKKVAPNNPVVQPCVLDLIELPAVASLVQLHHAVHIPSTSYTVMVEDYIPKWMRKRERSLLQHSLAITIGDSALCGLSWLYPF